MPVSRHYFEGVDSDTDDSARSPRSYVAGLNLSLLPGSVAPMRGNVPVPGYALPPGTTRCLGGLPDGASGTAVYLLYNSTGAHRIVRYNPAGAGTSTTLLEWAGLNLTSTLPIGVGVNGGILDDLLTYRDALGELRCINLARAAAGGYTAPYLAAEPFGLHLAKVPPTFVIEPSRRQLSTGAFGEELRLIQNKAYQFSYRYRYADGETTILAPFSGWLDILVDPAQNLFNTIFLTLPTTHPRGVTELEILVRDADGLVWQVADTLRRNTTGTLPTTYSFYGQILGSTVNEAEAGRLYEALWPCEAGPTLARNRVHAAVFTQGYVTPEPNFIASVFFSVPGTFAQNTLHERSTYRVVVQFYDALGRSGGCSQPRTVRVPSRAAGNTGLRSLQVELLTTGVAALNVEIPDWAVSYHFLVARNDRATKFLQGQAADALGYSGEKRTINDDTKVVSQTHRFSNVNGSNHQKTWIDIGNFPAVGQGYVWEVGDLLYIRDIDKEFTITGQEGDYLEIVYTGGIPNNSNGDTVPFIEIYTPNTTPAPIYYERGPRLRVLRDAQGNRSYEQTTVLLEGDCFVIPLFFPNIIKSDEYLLDSNNNKDFEPATVATLIESMVPAFRLAPSKTSITTVVEGNDSGGFFGRLGTAFGTIPDILAGDIGGAYSEIQRKFQDRDDRTSTLDRADTANRSALLWLDMSYGGRPGLAIPLALQRVRRNILRFSGQKQSGNLVNGLSRWEALSVYDKVPQEQGDVTLLALADQSQTDGSVLVALQQRGGDSLYLNQQPIQTDPTQQILSITSAVIGGDNTLNGGYGCTDPASLISHSGMLIYYCREQAEVIRYNKGNTRLGFTYKFSNRLKQLEDYYGPASSITACFDPRREEYWLTFRLNDLLATTVIWSERRLAWADAVSWQPEAGASTRNELLTWQAGQLYRHTPNAPVGTFGGIYTAPQLTFTVAPPDEAAKRWMSVEQRTEGGVWNLATLTTDTGQLSHTEIDWWEKREGCWLLPNGLKRDELTSSFANPVQALWEGNPLISPRATFTFTCPDVDPQPMSQILVSWLPRAGSSLGVSS